MEPQMLRGQVIHVNEDGWVVINRGAQDGVSEGFRFAVLGERSPRQIRNLFPASEAADTAAARPVVLRADTAYELLRVILVERECCVAISDRVPPERTPQVFLGPQGELLVYTPPPAEWRYDALDLEGSEEATANEGADASEDDEEAPAEAATDAAEDAGEAGEQGAAEEGSATDLTGRQQERLWDGALPLNAVQVGDQVVMATPYRAGAWQESVSSEASAPASSATSADGADKPASYDWLKL